MRKFIKTTTRGLVFTLVELLVVIGIIALLVSILLPALKKTREKAQQIHCLSNLKQLNVAIDMYCNDWSDWIPQLYWGSSYFWPHVLVQSGYIAGPETNASTPAKCFQCPSEKYKGSKDADGEWWCGTHYGLNAYLCTPVTSWPCNDGSSPGWRKKGQIKFPSKVYLLIDNKALNARAMPNYISLRHDNGLNVNYADGHADWLPLNEVAVDIADPEWCRYSRY